MAENKMIVEVVDGGLGGGTGAAGKSQEKTAENTGKTAVLMGATAGATMKLLDIILKLVPLGDILESGFSGIGASLSVLAKVLGLIVRPLVDLFIPAVMGLVVLLMPFITLMNAVFRPLMMVMMVAFAKFNEKLMPLMAQYMPMLLEIASGVGEFAAGMLQWWFEFGEKLFTGDFGGALDMLINLGTSIMMGLIEGTLAAIPYIEDLVAGIWGNIKDIEIGGQSIEDWVSDILAPLQAMWDFITGMFSGEGDNPIINFFQNMKDAAAQIVSSLLVIVVAVLSSLMTTLTGKIFPEIKTALIALVELLKFKFIEVIYSLIATTARGLAEFIENVRDALISIANAYNEVASIVPGMQTIDTGAISAAASAATKPLYDIAYSAETTAGTAAARGGEVVSSITVNVNGDVSGEELVNKIKENLERYQGTMLDQNGISQGLVG